MNNSNYLRLLVALTVGLMLFVSIANYRADPYGAFASNIQSVMQPAKSFESNVRMAKAHIVSKAKPESLVLGSSRAEIGLGPDHRGWRSPRAYNLGLPSANFREIERYLEHAIAVSEIDQVVVALDLFQFNPHSLPPPDYRECRLYSVSAPLFVNAVSALCDIPSLWLSTEGLSGLGPFTSNKKRTGVYLADGSRNAKAKEGELLRQGSHEDLFYASEVEYLSKGGLYDGLASVTDFSLHAEGQAFEALLRLAYQYELDLRLLISPSHVRQWELQDYLGVSEISKQWKRFLVTTNQQVAAEFSTTPFPLWDFADYNEASQEPVPSSTVADARMQWYWESSHFTRQLGERVLDQVLLGIDHGQGRDIAKADPAELNDWLVLIDARKKRYRERNRESLKMLSSRWPEPYLSR